MGEAEAASRSHLLENGENFRNAGSMTDEYRRYLASDEWKRTRERAFAYHGRYCAVCGTTKRLQCHHLTYARLGHELMTDLRILCKKHHPKGHYSAFEIDRDRHSLI